MWSTLALVPLLQPSIPRATLREETARMSLPYEVLPPRRTHPSSPPLLAE